MKKRNIKTLVTGLVLAAAMAVTPIMAMAATGDPSGAADENAPAEPTGANSNLKGAAIVTKVVNTAAEGVTVPDRSFTFTATLQNGSKSSYDGIKAPSTAPTEKTVTINKTNDNRSESTQGTIEFEKDKQLDIGFYVYRLTENDLGTGTPNDLDDKGYGWTKDTTEYQVTIFKSNTGTTQYAIQKVNNTDGTLSLGDKVDTADFKNKFTKRGNQEGKESSLKITKEVVNPEYAKDQSWDFTLKFTPDQVNEGILKDEIIGMIGNDPYTFTKDNDGNYSGTVTLKKDQTITFANIPAGTKYTLSENGYEGDTPTAVLKENGGKEEAMAAGTQGEAYTIKEGALIGEGENSVTVTNKYDKVTVTGVVLNNMPFIVMMAAAAAAIFGYVALKRKISK